MQDKRRVPEIVGDKLGEVVTEWSRMERRE